MEEALELGNYLPLSFKTRSEQDYIQFLWEAFESNYNANKFEFASLAFHLLYMSYVSFSIWQIRLAREADFKKALIGFQIESEMKLLEADSPFKFYDKLKESQIFRFLKLIGCENAQVSEFAKFVKRRNKIAHPSGTVFFNDKDSIDREIGLMMLEVTNIEEHMRPIILELYACFLEESNDPDDREYSEDTDQIREVLIHAHYLSRKDIEICATFDWRAQENLEMHTNAPGIESLHQTLCITFAATSSAT
ncbi:MAG: hypothetical protein SFU85_12205 [Candidatus Methylacidiphilales bacterium]|nr:hypothetical protein [Candidatus Methylacidiphilales bacterium]